MIPEAAVEAAAKASFAHWQPKGAWGENPRVVEIFMEDTRVILKAAAPHMLAAAFDHGRSVQHYTNLGWSVEDAIAIHADKTPDNPYRSPRG